jgi:hypothetical protein
LQLFNATKVKSLRSKKSDYYGLLFINTVPTNIIVNKEHSCLENKSEKLLFHFRLQIFTAWNLLEAKSFFISILEFGQLKNKFCIIIFTIRTLINLTDSKKPKTPDE